MLKWIDMPPVWLAGFLVLAWVQAVHSRWGWISARHGPIFWAGCWSGGGLVLIVMAAMEFRRYRTTIVPHETPERLIQTGIFRRSRNPIYLGDALILAGLILRWDAVLALPLVPVFVWIIERRFIIPEENRMRRTFRMEFARYCEKTRRWL